MPSMTLHKYLCAATACLLFGCGASTSAVPQPLPLDDHSVAGELSFICATFSDPRIQALGYDQQIFKALGRIEKHLRNESVIRALIGASASMPDLRYVVLRAGARHLGYPDWQCPAVERFYSLGVQRMRETREQVDSNTSCR